MQVGRAARRAQAVRAAIVGAVIVGGVGGQGTGASAAGDPSEPPPPDAANACSAGLRVDVRSSGPYIGGTAQDLKVFGHGEILQSPSWFCTVDRSAVSTQSKHCGVWGCNWHTNGSVAHTPTQSYWSATAVQGCRNGTHRYRTRTVYNYRQVDFIGGIPVLVPGVPIQDISIEPEFTCAPK